MNSKLPDDLLSAFHDREVSAADGAAAEAQVRASSKARQELDDYRRISKLLRDLPKHSAPQEFASSVMQRAERETLIPLDEPPRIAASKSRFGALSRRRLLIVAGAISAVAAIIVVAVSLPGRREEAVRIAKNDDVVKSIQPRQKIPSTNNQFDFLSAVKRPESISLSSTAAKAQPAAKPAAALAARSSSGKDSLAARTVHSTRAATPSLGYRSLETRPSDTGGNGAGSPTVAEKSAADELPQLVFPTDLKTSKVGDVVEALEQSGEQVAVVRLTIVNRSEGLDGIENVFVRNASRTVQKPEEVRRLRERIRQLKQAGGVSVNSNGPITGNVAGDLVCVYVEGTRDELLNVLQDVQNDSHIQEARLTNTISAAELERYSNGAVPPSAKPAKIPPAHPQLVLSLPVTTIDKIVSERQSARKTSQPASVAGLWGTRLAAGTPDRKGAVDSTAHLERQKSPSSNRFHDLPRSPSRSSAVAESGRPSERSVSAGAARANAPHFGRDVRKVVSSNRRSYQAFFVIVDQQNAPAQQKSGTAAPLPGAEKSTPPTEKAK